MTQDVFERVRLGDCVGVDVGTNSANCVSVTARIHRSMKFIFQEMFIKETVIGTTVEKALGLLNQRLNLLTMEVFD